MQPFYPLELFSRWVTYTLLPISQNSLLGNALEFFIADILKIFILLFVFVFIADLLRSYVSKEKIQRFLSHKRRYVGHVVASSLGVITPFCSCSAIPLFLSFIEAGVPIGIAFSFLIASPMINEVALILLFSLFGGKVALLYISSGLLVSILAGIILGKIRADKWILKDILIQDSSSKNTSCSCQKTLPLNRRIDHAKNYTLILLKKIWLYVFLGIGIGAWIHGFVPDDFLAHYATKKWYDVPLVVVVGIPLYSNAAAIVPLIHSLIEKGLSIGTSLAFMMAVTSLSLPEFLILKRIMHGRLLLVFAGIVGAGIIFIGYLFNFLLA